LLTRSVVTGAIGRTRAVSDLMESETALFFAFDAFS
jgi:hypothetical protein